MDQNPSAHIAQLLTSKSDVKQITYRNVCKTFKALKKEASKITEEINAKTSAKDEDLVLSVDDVSDQEFHLKVAGDLLVFFLHTNIITLSDDYSYNKSEYVLENPLRKYLGQINVYNFMSDSLKFNRVNDPGYLLSRLMINAENRFIVEGDGQINFMFESVSSKELEPTDLNILIQLIVTQAVENDLVAPPFQKIRGLTLQQKLAKTEVLGAGNKIGFQMSSLQDAK
ncbi:MAG: hypothetical protein ABJG78_09640 [Cyclobacteriaceae bacterium]